MKTLPCLQTLVSAVALALAVVATLPGPAPAADGIPANRGGVGTPGLPPTYQGPSQPQGTPPNENYRANYFVDYHSNPGNPGTQGAEGIQDSPANIKDSIGRRDVDMSSSMAREMSRFRGEMSTWRPGR
jgi:hypothetical protein